MIKIRIIEIVIQMRTRFDTHRRSKFDNKNVNVIFFIFFSKICDYHEKFDK